MKATRRFAYLAGVSALAAGIAVASSDASAFGKVDWTWELDIDEKIRAYIDICAEFDPDGMLVLEGLQIQIGDVVAKSVVFDIDNVQPDTNGGGGGHSWNSYGGGGHSGNGGIDALKELPEVISAATAVANNASIDTDAATQLHMGQFALDAGGYLTSFGSNGGGGHGGHGPSVNSNLEMAGTLTLAAILGALDKADIKAESYVFDIKNATVDSAATAVANNLSVNVEPTTASNSLFIGDVVQFAYADVTAVSKVSDVYLDGYKNLAPSVLGRPIVNSVATAVGNNLSISVKAPTVSP